MMMGLFMRCLLRRFSLPKLLAVWVLLYRGWACASRCNRWQQLQAGCGEMKILLKRPDSRLAGEGHVVIVRGWWCERPIASYVVEERCCGADLADRLKRHARVAVSDWSESSPLRHLSSTNDIW